MLPIMFSARIDRPRVVAAGLMAVVLTAACSSSTPSSSENRAPQVPSPSIAGGNALWGDLKPIVSVKELMRDMLDPAADNIFDAVKTVYTKTGVIETAPKTEKDW